MILFLVFKALRLKQNTSTLNEICYKHVRTGVRKLVENSLDVSHICKTAVVLNSQIVHRFL